jgi:hypothetical protein
MAETDPLETWSVATFNVVVFGLAGVLAGHASGALADALPGLGTLPGLAAFGYLWALVAVATRWALAGGGLARLADGPWPLLVRGATAGAGAGAAFVGGVALAGGAVSLATGGVPLGSLALLVVLGVAAGGVVGSVVGVAFVLVDAALYVASARLDPAG